MLTFRHYVQLAFLILFSVFASAQKKDTINISARNINTTFLKQGVNHYLVYMKNGIDSNRTRYQYWTRTVDYVDYNGAKAIRVQQQWEDNDTIIHKVNALCDAKTFATFSHDSWWKSAGNGQFDFIHKSARVRNVTLSDTITQPAYKKMYDAFLAATDQYFLNWHLDLEVFSLLPYKDDVTFMINFYDPGFGVPQKVAYTVAGSDVLKDVSDQKIDCWLLKHNDGNYNKETFWISKKTREVLKLEQEYKGRFRYKIKLGYGV